MNTDTHLLKAVLEMVDEPLLVVDQAYRVQRASAAFCKLVGATPAEIAGAPLSSVIKVAEPGTEADLVESLRTESLWTGDLELADGDVELATLHASPAALSESERLWLVHWTFGAHAHDTNIDEVTGLPDHSLLDDRLSQGIIAAGRVEKSLVLVLLGIERFGDIRSAYGSRFCDELLRRVVDRLQHCVRQSDTLARDRYDRLALVAQITAAEDAVLIARKLLKTMAPPFEVEGRSVHCHANIGISISPVDSNDAEELREFAVSALEHAEDKGGSRYEFYSTEMNSNARERVEIENRLHHAIDAGEFLLQYQPKVHAGTGRIVGAEALLRWIDSDGNYVSPGVFIPVAEQTGLIDPIGLWVLNQACLQNAEWQRQGLPAIKLSVNVASRQLADRRFVSSVADALAKSGLTPKFLELEITESMLVRNIDRTVEQLRAIRDLGCDISIDDFGTGYSSLSYLTRFPITTLKIDRAFIHGIESSTNTAEVAKAIIGLSKGLSLEVVAEGAESLAHVEFLKAHGCDAVQGYYYSKPVDTEAFEKLLEKGSIEVPIA
ncbi:MAG: EAL domain-containing protein [Xanthomonadales bacterium]|nr:EAL domain-containing protein [Xanthomonadales bacterium]